MTDILLDRAHPSRGLPANRIDRLIALCAIAAAVLYLLLQDMRPYPGAVYLKILLCLPLALLAWRHGKWLLVLAFAFSAAGDAFLAVDADRLFVPGLTSFLMTHLLYAAIFVRTSRSAPAPLAGWRKLALVVIPLFAIGHTAVLWPHLGALALPVSVYVAAIVTMAMLSLRVVALSVPVGAIAFMASDSLIALEKFLWQADWMGPAIWSTYAIAQLLIAHGLLVHPARDGRAKR